MTTRITLLAGGVGGARLAHGFAWILIVVGEMTGVPMRAASAITFAPPSIT